MQVNRDKSSVKGYKTLLLRVKQLKSKSNTRKQNQIKCKRIKNTAINNKSTKSRSTVSKQKQIKCKRI